MKKLKILKSIGKLLSPGGTRGSLTILIYHRVLKETKSLLPGEPDSGTFRWQMELMANSFTVIPLSEAIRLLKNECLPPMTACITFDDGYADNYKTALPILKSVGLPATFFIATGYLDGSCMWNDMVINGIANAPEGVIDLSEIGMPTYKLEGIQSRLAAIKSLLDKLKYQQFSERQRKSEYIHSLAHVSDCSRLMMTNEQVRRLSEAGMSIGAHTVTHPILSKVDLITSKKEIETGRKQLEDIINQRVDLFAYPNGNRERDYTEAHVEMVKSLGFIGAVSTDWGVASLETDCYQLPRFTPWDDTPRRFMLRLLQNYMVKT